MKKVLKKLVPISLVLGFVQNLISWHYVKDVAASEIAWLADANPGGFLNQNLSVIIRGVVGTGIGWLILIFIVVYIFKGFKKYFKNKTTKSDVSVKSINSKLDKNIFSKRNYFIVIIGFLILFLLSFAIKHSWYLSVVDLRLTVPDILVFFVIVLGCTVFSLTSVLFKVNRKKFLAREFLYLFVNICIALIFVIANTFYLNFSTNKLAEIEIDNAAINIVTGACVTSMMDYDSTGPVSSVNGSDCINIIDNDYYYLGFKPDYSDEFRDKLGLKKSMVVNLYTSKYKDGFQYISRSPMGYWKISPEDYMRVPYIHLPPGLRYTWIELTMDRDMDFNGKYNTSNYAKREDFSYRNADLNGYDLVFGSISNIKETFKRKKIWSNDYSWYGYVDDKTKPMYSAIYTPSDFEVKYDKLLDIPLIFPENKLTDILTSTNIPKDIILSLYEKETFYKIDLNNYDDVKYNQEIKEDKIRKSLWFTLGSKSVFSWFMIIFFIGYVYRLLVSLIPLSVLGVKWANKILNDKT